MKKLLGLLAVAPMALSACGGDNVEKFSARDSFGHSSSIFVFDGETTNGKITSLDFDVIDSRNNISKKDMDNYHMNVSDFDITENETDANNFDIKLFVGGMYESGSQFFATATLEDVKEDTKLSDLDWGTEEDDAGNVTPKPIDMEALKQAGAEYNFVPTADTTVIDWANAVEAIDGTTLEAVDYRFSFVGVNGGRSYGEQIDAMEKHILDEEYTLAEAKKFFEAGRHDSDNNLVVSGASIMYLSQFARIVDVAMGNKVEEGIIDSGSSTDGSEWYNVRTSGYGGDIILKVTTNVAGDTITKIEVVAESESTGYGKDTLEQANLDILMGLANADNLDNSTVVSGATLTHNAVVKGLKFVLAELA